MHDMDEGERSILERLDARLEDPALRRRLDEIADRVVRALAERPDDVMAWEPVPLELYGVDLPGGILSSWVFALRAGATSGAERHPNSRQRMRSWRGGGDFQSRVGAQPWHTQTLTSERRAPLEERWVSIAPNTWHQVVVPHRDWTVVSFQTATVEELVEERPHPDREGEVKRRRYVD